MTETLPTETRKEAQGKAGKRERAASEGTTKISTSEHGGVKSADDSVFLASSAYGNGNGNGDDDMDLAALLGSRSLLGLIQHFGGGV